jgi:hypothetical protein
MPFEVRRLRLHRGPDVDDRRIRGRIRIADLELAQQSLMVADDAVQRSSIEPDGVDVGTDDPIDGTEHGQERAPRGDPVDTEMDESIVAQDRFDISTLRGVCQAVERDPEIHEIGPRDPLRGATCRGRVHVGADLEGSEQFDHRRARNEASHHHSSAGYVSERAW